MQFRVFATQKRKEIVLRRNENLRSWYFYVTEKTTRHMAEKVSNIKKFSWWCTCPPVVQACGLHLVNNK